MDDDPWLGIKVAAAVITVWAVIMIGFGVLILNG